MTYGIVLNFQFHKKGCLEMAAIMGSLNACVHESQIQYCPLCHQSNKCNFEALRGLKRVVS